MFWYLFYLKTGDSRSFGSWPKNPVVTCIFFKQAYVAFKGPQLFSFHPLACGLRRTTWSRHFPKNYAFFLDAFVSGRSVPLFSNVHTWLSLTIFPAVYLESHLWFRFSVFHEGIIMQDPMIVAYSVWIGSLSVSLLTVRPDFRGLWTHSF